MFELNIQIDTSKLPSNVMSLHDGDFLNFLRQEAGHDAADLLEAQNDDTYVVKPGMRRNVDYFIDLLKLKCVEDAKRAKSSKNIQSSSSLSSLNRTTVASSTGTKLVSDILLNALSKTSPIKHSNLSNNEHKKYIVDSINSWWENNKSNINSSQFSLIEGQHFFISILNRPGDTIMGKIKCCCGKMISLTINRGKFQISNFYRHFQGSHSGVTCRKIKELIKN
ncbi:unnamed protein product [Rotaria sordida]|uniref:Uncharacterized protein n=1 Tax=Rotaria sordida TaxID=392033 RepID=A0A815LEY3_9BILA|nr:unnamed protein product [Rotaria sordida]CAF3993599.1 unnamed protein product [Rotaria sordida]